MSKYIFVTGGVLSSLGKGIAAASIGALLEASGLKVTSAQPGVKLRQLPPQFRPVHLGKFFGALR